MQNKSTFAKYLFVLLIIIMTSPAVYSNPSKQLEDVVYLKDGSIIRGTLIEQIPGESLKIETSDGKVFVIKIEQIKRFTKEARKVNIVKVSNNQKNGALAFLFSFILPGGGQFYNGETDKGIGMLGISAVGAYLILSNKRNSYTYYDKPNSAGKFGVLFFVGGTLWSLIDAPISSARINRENELASGFRISDKIYVDLGMSDLASKETSFIRAVVTF